MSQKGVCPRCKTIGVEVGTTILQIGRTRGIKLTTFNCPKCELVFFEKVAEE